MSLIYKQASALMTTKNTNEKKIKKATKCYLELLTLHLSVKYSVVAAANDKLGWSIDINYNSISENVNL